MTLRMNTETFVFVYIETCGFYTSTFSPKMVHIIVIIKQYLHDSHVTIVPRAWSGYALSVMPPKQAAASKKKKFVWTDDEGDESG